MFSEPMSKIFFSALGDVLALAVIVTVVLVVLLYKNGRYWAEVIKTIVSIVVVVLAIIGLWALIVGYRPVAGYHQDNNVGQNNVGQKSSVSSSTGDRSYGDVSLPCVSVLNSVGGNITAYAGSESHQLAPGSDVGFCDKGRSKAFVVSVVYGGKTYSRTFDTTAGRQLWIVYPEGRDDIQLLNK